MKRFISIFFCMILVLGLAACGSQTADTAQNDQIAETQEAQDTSSELSTESTEVPQTSKDVLVVYFSATGTTKGVAE